jgi:hypothetical protein
MDVRPAHELEFTTRRTMAAEGRSMVDAGRSRGVVLRLLGGIAVQEHCGGLEACRREHADVDLAGLRRQTGGVTGVFAALGFRERLHVRQATGLGQAQFTRACAHAAPWGGWAHEEDHVDVFFDRFKLDHAIDLRHRLGLHPYTLSLSDLLATKLQMHAPEPRDVRDAVALLAAPREPAGPAGVVDPAYLAALCARDWGLFYDVTRNLQRCSEALGEAGLTEDERARAAGLVARLTGAIDAVPKSRSWRLRARVGTRRRWYDIVEEQGGTSS